jgi:hypothetical protein
MLKFRLSWAACDALNSSLVMHLVGQEQKNYQKHWEISQGRGGVKLT